MRQFSNKEKEAFARAFQTFVRSISGQRFNISTYSALIERALAQGLTMDEILNQENFNRVAQIIQKPSAEEYIDSMINRNVAVHYLTEDVGWDEVSRLKVVSEAFHDFYVEILPKGGTFNTPNALDNIRKAILRHGLQTIMSETLIEKHKESNLEESKQTIFQYVVNILRNAEDLGVTSFKDNLSSEQMSLAQSNEETGPENEPETKEEIVPGEHFNDHDDSSELNVETIEEQEQENAFAEEEDEDGVTSSFNINIDPKEYKAQTIHDIILGYNLTEIQALAECVSDGKTLNGIIDSLAKGHYDKSKETLETRKIHQFMNADLISAFVKCVRIEGIEMDDKLASNYDVLLDDWDLRNSKTRKKDKIKNLIYQAMRDDNEDPDLLNALEDIEKLYSE